MDYVSNEELFDEQDLDMFREPEDYLPPPPQPTFFTFSRQPECVENDSLKEITVRLVGSHPLWGHFLWNAAKCFAWYIDENKEIVRGKHILELGAGAGLPSLIASANGAEKVVITDYPDNDLIENLQYNVASTFPDFYKNGRTLVLGYVWGKPVHQLLSALSPTSTPATKFDLIILSDLIFNHSQHTALLKTCRACITPETGQILVFFTHHRPHIQHKDMKFFEDARNPPFEFQVEKIFEKVLRPMFDHDSGSEIVRATVHGYKMSLPA